MRSMAEKYTVLKTEIKKDGVTVILAQKDSEPDVLELSLEDFLEESLHENDRISSAQYLDLKKKSVRYKAYRLCIRKLSVKDRTEKEIRGILSEQAELSKKDAEEIFGKLKRKGYIDDSGYADTVIQDLRASLFGKERILKVLKEKGISEELIREKLNAEKPEKEIERGAQYAGMLIKTLDKYPQKEKRGRLLRKLVYRGYEKDDCTEILSSITFEKNEEKEHALLRKAFDSAYTRHARKYEGPALKNAVLRSLLSKGFRYDDIMEYWNENGGTDQ